MKTELIIANKSGGKMWEISNSVPEVTWSTERTGSPGISSRICESFDSV